jgi:hypothetical protein
MEAIFSFISEQYPLIGWIILGIAIVVVIDRFLVSIQNTKKKVKNLPCDENGKKIDATAHLLDSIAAKVNNLPCGEHEKKLSDISTWVMKKDKSMIETLTAKSSPYHLTDAGKKLLEISGGKQCIDQNLDMFMSEIGSRNPLTPYDVEEMAGYAVLECKNLTIFNRIKNFLYYMPKTIEGVGNTTDISIFSMANIMVVYLRDIYLDAHPEIISENEFSLTYTQK